VKKSNDKSDVLMYDRVIQYLNSCGVSYRTVHHRETFTSEESAKARGEDIAIGGKAIVMKVDDRFHMFVLSAARKLDSKKVKEYFGAKNLRFANKEELFALTGLVPGSVPPFGSPLFEIKLYVDTSVHENEKIAFNAGSLTDSVVMDTHDYISVASPTIFSFSL
jgi:Ala-tRNA(Pro) deacylase